MTDKPFGLPERVACPFCDRDDTELHSPFGTVLSAATYWCRSCHTAFEWIKWGTGEPGRTAGTDAD